VCGEGGKMNAVLAAFCLVLFGIRKYHTSGKEKDNGVKVGHSTVNI